MVMKKTDLGLFPIDWSVSDWSSVLDGFTSGATPSRAIKDYFKGNIRWITSGELNYNIIIDTIEHISKDAVKQTNLTVHPAGTFLMAITGLEAEGTRGSCGIIGKESTTNQSCLAIYGTSRLMIPYLFYFYVKYGDWLAKHYCQGTKQQSYTASLVKQLPIIYPPSIEEQRCITEVLSDVDNLISSLQKLIEKKKAIKQGAMQELLTGKKRLPGFYGEWKREQLPELLQEQNGIKIGPFGSQLKKEYLIDIGEFKVYGQENVYEKDFRLGTRYIPKERYLKLKSCELLPGDFVISSMGTVGKCAIVPQNIQIGIMDSHLIRLKFNCKKIIPQYILQLFSDEFDFLRNQIEKLSVGGIMDGLSTKIVQSLHAFYPVNIDEQKAICAILNDMDDEIAQLEKKLAKYQQIKQGMMQELLTGRIRLV